MVILKTTKTPGNRPGQTHSDISWPTASGNSPLSCLSLFSNTLGGVARNSSLKLFSANSSDGNSSVQRVTVQAHVLPCSFCAVDLLKKKEKKLKRGSKEEHWGSRWSQTGRIHRVCVRHSCWMADSYMMMKSWQIFCFEGPGLHLEYRRPYSTPHSTEMDLKELGMKCRCMLLFKPLRKAPSIKRE